LAEEGFKLSRFNHFVEFYKDSHIIDRHFIVIACPHWRQKLPKTATNCSRSYSRRKRQKKLPETATNVPETATFVAVFGNFCRQCGQAIRLLYKRAY